MTLDQALNAAHSARRRADCDCGNVDCTHCAAIVLAAEVRRQDAQITQLRRHVDAKAIEKKPAQQTKCPTCKEPTIDGMCAVCSS